MNEGHKKGNSEEKRMLDPPLVIKKCVYYYRGIDNS